MRPPDAHGPILGERQLQTERLVLRPWRDSDREPFARLNADAEVMRYFPERLPRAQSDELAARAGSHVAEHGWGLWAVEVIGGPEFIGFVGLNRPTFTAHFTPAVEVGWRLAREHWGNGYATEAAIASLRFGFEQLRLVEIVSFTSVLNARSRAVMERIGMSRDPGDDFVHPRIPPGPLSPHVLYRASRDAWPLRERVRSGNRAAID